MVQVYAEKLENSFEETYLVNQELFEEDEKITPEEFGFYLVSMREVIGITQYEMADILEYNKNTYNSYEKGKRIPKDWENVMKNLQLLVKEHISKQRQFDNFKINIDFKLGLEIIDLHEQGKNIVQIGIKLDLDECLVESFLLERNYEPRQFNPSWDKPVTTSTSVTTPVKSDLLGIEDSEELEEVEGFEGFDIELEESDIELPEDKLDEVIINSAILDTVLDDVLLEEGIILVSDF